MRKILLSSLLLSATAVFAADQPQSGFWISGINGESTQTENNTLTYVPGDEDDIEEGIYRYINEAMEIKSCNDGFTIVGAEGMILGYDKDNYMGAPNLVNDKSAMMYLIEDGEPVNCELSAGTYKVILASFQEDETEPMTWMIQFYGDASESVVSYYIYGFNGAETASQDNKFVREEIFDDETGEISYMYSYPKFLVESCDDGFFIGNADMTEIYGGDDTSTITDEMPFAMLSLDGSPVKSELTPGYYTVNFIDMGFMAMATFLMHDNQTPADEATYYLLGFDGVTTQSDNVKFTRTENTFEYEDEETGENFSETSISYIIDKIHLASCPDGFLIKSSEEEDFSFGINSDMASFLGEELMVMEDGSAIGFLGINGEAYNWNLDEGDYTVTFICNGTMGSVSFVPYGEASVENIETTDENAIPVYYNLQGQRVNNPEKGIFIKVQGSKVTKIMK